MGAQDFKPAIFAGAPFGGRRAQHEWSIRWPDRANSPSQKKSAPKWRRFLMVLRAPTFAPFPKHHSINLVNSEAALRRSNAIFAPRCAAF